MASKKAGRLAGLAALAGLAYMANKKGETKDAAKSESKSKSYDRDTDTGVDAMASDAAKKPAADLGEIRDEAGTLSKFRRNTETGEMYDPIGTSPAKVARAEKTSSASVTKAPIVGGPTPVRDPGGAGKRGAVSAGPTPARAPGGVGKRGGVSNEEKANMMDLPPYRENPDSYDMSMKRGGKVKKMASGGMASKRGDGIASKGKTRCKMY
jgi:hypothetical protein